MIYKHLVATVKLKGKTGERTNQLFSSVPYLRMWLACHPCKDDPNAPVFISTKESRYGQRLTSVGVNKILQRAAKKAQVKRHIHAHLFRHTNLTRMARILSESELKIHAGWGSDSKMASVYVHLTEQDVADKILANFGIKKERNNQSVKVLEVQICPNTLCSYSNGHSARFCVKCGYPLTLETAVSLNRLKEKEQELHNELFNKSITTEAKEHSEDVKQLFFNILKADPVMIKSLKEIIDMAENLKKNRGEDI